MINPIAHSWKAKKANKKRKVVTSPGFVSLDFASLECSSRCRIERSIAVRWLLAALEEFATIIYNSSRLRGQGLDDEEGGPRKYPA